MSELHIGSLYWPSTLHNPPSYPALTECETAQVVVIGGGMSGITCAWELISSGIDVILVEREIVAGESTSANTGLLQYCNDVMLSDLIGQIGRESAETFYVACSRAIDKLADIAASLPEDVGFRRRSSLYYASTEQDLPKLKQEYEALSSCGLRASYWTSDDIAAHFPFRKPGAIVTGGDAEVNPFRFVTLLAAQAVDKGLRIREYTEIVKHDSLAGGRHRLHTGNGHYIDANHVIYAIGYEPEELRGQLIKPDIGRSFVIVTEPVPDLSQWHERYMIWETARPYLYLRTTEDNRIIIGGLDEEDRNPLQSKQRRKEHSEKLLEKGKALFPELPLTIAYDWNATFGESEDNLPFVGEDPKWPGVYYTLGYGGNGTVYSLLGAELIRELIQGEADSNPLKDIIGLSRATLREGTPR
ncbi:NAD(P)/FAD-dependent oxidoreductase [Paenibacillus agaridevorans]|uniref:NAD(P)/FAD-dependent oxidoreductase n=1 Tax=Paenibacillus agaridevorans TaxID=171404 RepID=UPI001BE4D356|nr:FAD-dependent oxidoreductase [Paenibacillus agaridevorans]